MEATAERPWPNRRVPDDDSQDLPLALEDSHLCIHVHLELWMVPHLVLQENEACELGAMPDDPDLLGQP